VAIEQTRGRRPGRAAVGLGAIITAAALGVSGCAAGRDAQTAYERPTIDGAITTVGQMSLNGLTIQAPVTTSYAKGSSASMRIVLVNSGPSADTLTGITSPSFRGWAAFDTLSQAQSAQAAATATPTAAPSSTAGTGESTPPLSPTGSHQVPVPANSRVSFGTPESKGALLLTGFLQPAYPGSDVPMTFTFARAGAVTVQVPVGLTNGPNDSVIPSASGGSE
jgi:copper(I)-binding protein